MLKWLIRKLVTAWYRKSHFLIYSWGIDEKTDIYIISEEFGDKYRFGTREENTCEN